MAEPGRTVRVSGLPTDIEDDRLRDKLSIHFLRAKNGGGEIDSVILIKATPASALITFEDSTVAQRVVRRSWHVLDVDGKKYKLTAVEHCESLDPDQIILNLTATVNYSQLPGGVNALTSLHKSHRDVQMNYTANKGSCTLHGSYSKVQAALAQLLGHPAGPESANNSHSDRVDPSSSQSAQPSQKPCTPGCEDQSKKPNQQREKNPISILSDEYISSSERDLTPGVHGWEDSRHTDSAALHPPATSVEDSSLIVDADMFHYLRKHCGKEYQHILSQYGVEVIDETNQGLTTLFFHGAETAVMDDGREQERLKLARKAISRLYQENESKIRRAQLAKAILSPRGGLQRALQNLSVRFPKLLLNEDEKNIYIIGCSSDVSEAKTSLLLDLDEVRHKKEDVYDFGSSLTYADEQRVPHPMHSTVGSVDPERTDQMVGSEEDEMRAGGGRRYKLAARFKDSGLPALGSRPTDFTFRANSSPSQQTRLGPMRGHDVLAEKAGTSAEAVSRAIPQNTGGDILFKTGYSLPPFTLMQSKTSSNTDMMDTRPKTSASPHSSLSGSSALPPAGSGSTLRRASSFSGTPQQKAQVVGQKNQDDSSQSTVRTRVRSSSFSDQMGRNGQEVHHAEISVSRVMWSYINEAYCTRVEDLTSDVLMKDSYTEGSKDLIVTITGADSSRVRSCQQSLQKLVDSVGLDFSVQELRLSELGVTDEKDETLQACCSEMKSRFKKVTVQIYKKSLYLLGPQQLCSQVVATLREVFSGDAEQQHLSSPSSFLRNSPTSSQMNMVESTCLDFNSNSNVVLGTQTGKSATSPEWKTTYTSDFCEKEGVNGPISQSSVRKDYVMKEKVKIASTVEVDGHKGGNQCVNRNNTSTSPVNGIEKERTTCAPQTDTTGQNTPGESRSGQGGWVSICVCGENGTALMRTKCGATMCPKCLETVHAKCKVCHETEPMQRGIQGDIKKSRLSISLPGHNKDCVIKITYRIPDGIQGEGHPSPGKPFKGGVFEAYLPECEKAKKLLPRLGKAFRQGLTFTVTGTDTEARVTWDCIPHKTSLQGGKAEKGYPDSTYLTRLSEVLSNHGIE
ncbi:uncharacterized protein PAE49_023421 isoform 1-T2 [Odontesthes bonariensis]|uniref:uncharacterized protein LOC142372072 n=1 Tax=Odontesthes bonariensis TaxID=219752 RepID=UPI003F58F5ED